MEDFGSNSLAKIGVAGRWEGLSNNGNLVITAGAGPFGEAALQLTGGNNVGFGNCLTKSVIGDGTQMTTCYVCFWFKIAANTSNVSNGISLAALFDGITTQCSLNINTSGQLAVNRGGPVGTQLVAAASPPIGQYGWLVWKTVLGTGTAGSTEVRWNGTTILGPTSNLNTANSGVARANGIACGSVGGNNNSGTLLNYFIADFLLFRSFTISLYS